MHIVPTGGAIQTIVVKDNSIVLFRTQWLWNNDEGSKPIAGMFYFHNLWCLLQRLNKSRRVVKYYAMTWLTVVTSVT